MRMKFFVYCAYSFYAVLVYSFVAHWVWADNGFLNQLGVHDFAGSGPVHLFGAVNGMVAILMVGPRTGRFDGSRPVSDFNPSSPSSQLFGLFMLWWGWYVLQYIYYPCSRRDWSSVVLRLTAFSFAFL